MDKKALGFLISLIGLALAKEIYSKSFKEKDVSSFNVSLLALVGLTFFIYILYENYNEYARTKKFKSFSLTFYGLFFIIINLYLNWYFK